MSAAHTPMVVAAARALCAIGAKKSGIDQEAYWAVYSDALTVEAAAVLNAVGAPELLEALRECVDAMWQVDSHSVVFDSTVLFGPSYDFSGIDGPRREEFLAEHCCIVWPSGGIGASKWSAYCTFDGSLWFERFATATEAKEQCMRMLDKVMPAHPAMKARAAIAKATGGAQ